MRRGPLVPPARLSQIEPMNTITMCDPLSDGQNESPKNINLEKDALLHCDKCDKCFINFHELSSHRAKHFDLEDLHCDKCDKCFIDFKDLCAHRARHFEVFEIQNYDDCEIEVRDPHIQEKQNACDVDNETELLRSHYAETLHVDLADSNRVELLSKTSNNNGESRIRLERIENLKCDNCERDFSEFHDLCAHRVSHFEENQNVGLTKHENEIGKTTLPKLNQLPQTEVKSYPKRHLCHVCGKLLCTPSKLIEHGRTHTREKPFKCQMCQKGFSTRTALTIHGAVHSKEKRYLCHVCGKCFGLNGNLIAHKRRVHGTEKPFRCGTCGKCFVMKSYLTKHELVHFNKEAFKCDICGRCYSAKSALKTHTRLHTGEKPYTCDLCDMSFTWQAGLNYHKSRRHLLSI